jgi:hypothetical protein
MNDSLDGRLARACLVVAHPDDEVLWFSSILDRVANIVVCFEHCADLPELSEGRARVRLEYPLSHVTWLQEAEPCSVHQVDWSQPAFGPHGLALNAPAVSAARVNAYNASYARLRAALAPRVAGMTHVITHNPWGEYGHPDHAQVARVLADLGAELDFRLLYSGYVASRTMPLAAQILPRLGTAYRLPTQPEIAAPIEALYHKHACWTWPSDYQRFESETFLEDTGRSPAPGWGFALNCVTA